MSSIKLITYVDINPSIHTYYIGWSEEELEAYDNQYQTQYYGSTQDARFEITDDNGNVSYAIFRSPEIDEKISPPSQDVLLFKDQNRVLLNITGKLYRFLINEKKVLDDSCFQGILCNDFDEPISYYFHSLVSPPHEIMIVVDNEGIAALTWDHILWKHNFESASRGYLNLLAISGNEVTAKYESPGDPDCLLSFNLQTGEEKC
jgi:hypothetical protein